MFGFLKNNPYAIGVDIGDDGVKIAQLANNGKGISLLAGTSENRPLDVNPVSGAWQKWAIKTIRELTANGNFHGKEVVAAIPANEVFVENIKMPKTGDNKLEDTIFSKIKQKLPFEAAKNNTMIKYIPTEEDNILVMATERNVIDRHLAIYEQANLKIKSIGVWPAALANCYTSFFGRRKSDLQAVVMLLDIEPNYANVVICRHKNLLFSRSISVAAKDLGDKNTAARLVLELTSCRRQFTSMFSNAHIERLIFLSGRAVEKDICAAIAKQLEMPAQMGDCLAAVQIDVSYRFENNPEQHKERSVIPIDRRNCSMNWAIAFGLSLS